MRDALLSPGSCKVKTSGDTTKVSATLRIRTLFVTTLGTQGYHIEAAEQLCWLGCALNSAFTSGRPGGLLRCVASLRHTSSTFQTQNSALADNWSFENPSFEARNCVEESRTPPYTLECRSRIQTSRIMFTEVKARVACRSRRARCDGSKPIYLRCSTQGHWPLRNALRLSKLRSDNDCWHMLASPIRAMCDN